jgi:hypothetical protein
MCFKAQLPVFTEPLIQQYGIDQKKAGFRLMVYFVKSVFQHGPLVLTSDDSLLLLRAVNDPQ